MILTPRLNAIMILRTIQHDPPGALRTTLSSPGEIIVQGLLQQLAILLFAFCPGYLQIVESRPTRETRCIERLGFLTGQHLNW